MNGAAQQQQRPAQAGPAGMAGMIRPEQVARLPQLLPQQKQQFHQLVTRLWELINTTPTTDPKYQLAQQKLLSTSQQLMNGVKQFRAAQQAQIQAQAQARAQAASQTPHNQAQGQQPNGVASQGQAGTVPFESLAPEIQQRVNEQHFFFPPAMVEGTKTADTWLREAKARYGQALQRTEMARKKKMEMQRAFQLRESQGNPLTAPERQVYQGRVAHCNKAIAEGQSFMEKFKEQQASFQRQQSQQRFSNPALNTGPATAETPVEQAVTSSVPNVQAPSQGAPSAHSITSAVTAARNAAALAAQQPGSPAHPQSAAPASATSTVQKQLNAAQSPAHTQPMGDHSRPSSAHPSQPGSQAQGLQPQSTTPHAHPLSAVNGIKSQGPAITKNLQVTETKPVQMPPSRPTLNGGAAVGLPGQLAQPALTSLPTYVLESSEDSRVLSKKKLNDLVREVCGPSSEDQLTAEAEEIFLQVADDFVDNLVQASCRLAKLRGSASLEPRDIMVVLERQYNIRIPGYSVDDARTVRKGAPAPGWAQKMGAVQAAKLTGGGSSSQALGSVGLNARDGG